MLASFVRYFFVFAASVLSLFINTGCSSTLKTARCVFPEFDEDGGEVPVCLVQSKLGDWRVEEKYLERLRFHGELSKEVSQEVPSISWLATDGDLGLVYVNSAGQLLIKRSFVFDNGPDPFVEGLSRFVDNDKIGFADIKGQVIIPAQFDCAFQFENGSAKVCEGCHKECSEPDDCHATCVGGLWWLIDKAGKKIKDLNQ